MGLAVIFRDFVLFLFVQLCCLSRLKNGDPLTAPPPKNFAFPIAQRNETETLCLVLGLVIDFLNWTTADGSLIDR